MKAKAKLTLNLNIEDKREDGFNNLKALTVFLNDIYDELTIKIDSDNVKKLSIEPNNNSLIDGDDNLILKAFNIFLDKLENEEHKALMEGISFIVNKQIPVSAGLGGGSADAAATLIQLNHLTDNYFDIAYLAKLGSEIGSDIPACVYSNALWMQGRGEIINLISDFDTGDLKVLVITPNIYCSTPQVFKHYDEIGRPKDSGTLEKSLDKYIPKLSNDLSLAAYDLYPELNQFKNKLDLITNYSWNLAGSGSTLFALGNEQELSVFQNEINNQFSNEMIRLNAISSFI